MMITLQLTEAEAARICYAMAAEANEANRRAWDEKKNGALSIASGRLQIIHENNRDEALEIIRRIEKEIGE